MSASRSSSSRWLAPLEAKNRARESSRCNPSIGIQLALAARFLANDAPLHGRLAPPDAQRRCFSPAAAALHGLAV